MGNKYPTLITFKPGGLFPITYDGTIDGRIIVPADTVFDFEVKILFFMIQ